MDQRRHRRRAGHRVGQPDVERNLGGLADGADEQAQPDQRGEPPLAAQPRGHRHRALDDRRKRGLDLAEVQRRSTHVGERPQDQEDADQEPEVADPVDDERLHPAMGVPAVSEPEADQEVGAEPHTLPAEEHHQQVVPEHQQQHRGEEQVQVAEEALEAAIVSMVVVHVADRVDVDQRADASDDQAHHRGQRIEQERHLGDQTPGADPRVDLVDQRRLAGRKVAELEERHHRHEEGERGGRARDRDHEPARQLTPQHAEHHAVHDRPEQGQQHDPAQQLVRRDGLYHFSRLTSSTFTDSRLRNREMTMPSPTATSHAATTMTISTKTWPSC